MMGPDHADGPWVEQSLQAALDLPAHCSRRSILFGKVAKRRFHERLDWRLLQDAQEKLAPMTVGSLPGGQGDTSDRASKPVHDMRRGQLDDPPDAAGPEVRVEDDQFQVGDSIQHDWKLVNAPERVGADSALAVPPLANLDCPPGGRRGSKESKNFTLVDRQDRALTGRCIDLQRFVRGSRVGTKRASETAC